MRPRNFENEADIFLTNSEDVIPDPSYAFSAFKEEFPEFFPSASGDEGSPDLKSRMERMTEYAERSAQFSKHLHLHSLLTAAFNERNLRDVCELEALMVSGRDIWDESVEPQDVLASVSGLLGKVTLSDEDKTQAEVIAELFKLHVDTKQLVEDLQAATEQPEEWVRELPTFPGAGGAVGDAAGEGGGAGSSAKKRPRAEA